MTNETKVQYLQRASIGCIIVALGYIYFSFPFWFLNAIDKVDAHQIAPFLFVADNPLSNFYAAITGIAMLIVAYSFQKIGEPSTKRFGFYILFVAAVSVFLCTWLLVPFAPLGALLNGIGWIIVGIASIKSRIWSGWKSYTPLLVGCFPFVFMYPLLILTGNRPPTMIGLWCIPWTLMGLAAWQRSKELTLNISTK